MLKKTLPVSLLVSAALLVSVVSPVFAQEAPNPAAATGIAAPVAPSPSAKVTPSPKAKAVDALLTAKERAASKAADLRPLVASGGGTLRDKLKTFKDQKKAALIERISQTFVNINQRRTSEMLRHIDTMNMILSKAQDRATTAQSAGTDVSAATTDMTSASNALANAKTAVEGQSKKTYDIKIASESGARADVKLMRDALEKDLKSTHELVAESRRILINAIVKLAQSLGEQVNATN